MFRSSASAPAALGLCILAAACGGSPDTPDGAMETLAAAFVDRDVGAVWEMAPPSYQEDIQSIVRAAAEKLDEETYARVFAVGHKLHDVMDSQSEYILGSSMLGALNLDEDQLEEHWDEMVDSLEMILESDLARLEDLADLDVGEFLGDTVTPLLANAYRVAAIWPQAREAWDEYSSNADASEHKVVGRAAGRAMVESSTRSGSGRPDTIKLVQIEGKWVPKEVAEEWKEVIAYLKDVVTASDVARGGGAARPALKAAESTLDALAAAESQEEFDQALKDIVSNVFRDMGIGRSSWEYFLY